jgi:hypothetical protein
MPMVRIDLIRGKSEGHRQAIGEAVHQALISIGVPANDRFRSSPSTIRRMRSRNRTIAAMK